MFDRLLADASGQAERCDPPVRAAALLRIARVEMTTDPGEARKTFDRGLETIRSLSGRDREFLFDQARFMAAAVAPELLSEIPGFPTAPMFAETLVNIMIGHGHVDEAILYLSRYDEATEFPFGMVPVMMQQIEDEAAKPALLRHAIDVWRSSPPYDPMSPPDGAFIQMFQGEWKALPREEALAVVREIVSVTRGQPEQPMTATYEAGNLEFTSWRAHSFFQILDVLRHLDPPLAELLIAEHAQLAKAARRFPNGLASMREEMETRQRATPQTCEGGHILMGSPEDFSFLESLIQASRDGDFETPIEHALKRYGRDSAPDNENRAPREFWPSTCAFRSILYKAGKRLGRNAAVYLDRVPESDLRLFAQIELAAALAGLPEFRGTQREYRPHPSQRSTPNV